MRTPTPGSVRDDLRSIVELAGLPLLAEAMRQGTDDSEAALLIGPAADPEIWRARRRDENYRDHAEDWLGDQHPTWILGQWDMLVREHLDQPTTLSITVQRAADYLDSHLTDLARDQEFPFTELGEEIRACLRHLEDVVCEGLRSDRGAPCMTCGTTLVRETVKAEPCHHDTPARGWLKVLTSYGLPAYWYEVEAGRWCGRCDQGGRTDRWLCPGCRATSTEAQYRYAVQQLHHEQAPELTDQDCAVRTGVKAGTIRVWATRGHVRRRRVDGRVLYTVEDVVRHAASAGLAS